MPLRDHFRSLGNDRPRWDAVHAMWPAMIVRELNASLPLQYSAAPGVHLGRGFEVDISTFEDRPRSESSGTAVATGIDVATSAPPRPTLTLETDLLDEDEYEVRIYDEELGRLVAVIELVSPSNKGRPETRRLFVAKVASLLQKEVCVSILDVVTARPFNLYAELLDWLGAADPKLEPSPPGLYAVTLRARHQADHRSRFEAWFVPLAIGGPLPTLPIWLSDQLHMPLGLESSYEETCRSLRIA